MAAYTADLRDVKFLLYEVLDAEQLLKYEKFSAWDRPSWDQVIDGGAKIAKNELYPLFRSADEEGCHYDKGHVTMPKGYKELWKMCRDNGWVAPNMNPEYGGTGLPHLIATAAGEPFASANVSFILTLMLTRESSHLIESFGSEELKKTYCEKMYSGEWAGTMCLTEPQAGSDIGATKTTAAPISGTDSYKIEGTKIFITSGEHDLTENIVHLALARRTGAPKGTRGISLFVVPKKRLENGKLVDNDVFCAGIEHKMGIKGSPTCVLNFGEKGNCRGWLVGEGEKGMRYMFQMMNAARIDVGMQGLSGGAASLFNAINYAHQRLQMPALHDFGKDDAPQTQIINHPDVRRSLLYMKSVIEGMRAMFYETSLYNDLSEISTDKKQVEKYEDYLALLTPVCKAYGSDMGFRVTEMGIQVFGGYGYCCEYGQEQLCRDTKIASIYEGTNGIQALDLMARKMTAKKGAIFMSFLNEINVFLGNAEKNPRMAPTAKWLARGRDALGEVALKFSQMGLDIYPLYCATPFLRMLGHVAVGYYTLKAALVADEKLQALYQKHGTGENPAARKRLTRDNIEARFYDGKVRGAHFFMTQVLPEVFGIKESLLSLDRSGLEYVFPDPVE
jgi:alkylation response protein AidB-like acyl-CoA dehydrogenase